MNAGGWSGDDASSVFLWRLAALPLDAWSRVAAGVLTDPHRSALLRARACCAVPALAVAEWSLRDDLETIGHHVRALSASTALSHVHVDRMLRAAEGAARALLVRGELEPAQFDALYAPFAEAVPLTNVVPPSAVARAEPHHSRNA